MPEKPTTSLSLIKKNPEIAAVISKLTTPRLRPSQASVATRIENSIDHTQLTDISHSISQRITDSENIIQMFPDIELASQILISSILSPKDMVETDFVYKTEMKGLPSEVGMAINTVIKDSLNARYALEDNAPAILKEMLFTSGAYAEAIIPENVVDQLINNHDRLSMEDISELSKWAKNTGNLGLLGDISKTTTNVRIGLESLETSPDAHYNGKIHVETDSGWTIPDKKELEAFGLQKAFENISVTDDYRVLKIPKMVETLRTHKINDIVQSAAGNIKLSTESLTNQDFTALLYKGPNGKAAPFVTMPTEEQAVRESVSPPLVMKFPTESIIPVYTPGNEKDHIGYFVLIDGEGNPVTKTLFTNQLNGFTTPTGDQSASMSSLLLNRARNNLLETSGAQRQISIPMQAEIYASIVEADLLARLKKGIYGDSVSLAKNTDIYRIMFARSMANQYTRLLYVPKEIMTYFAFNYYETGIGKSLLDDLRVMLSLRAIILFSKVMALTKNAIAMTHVNITLDPNDPDPQKTIEMSVHEIVRMRQQYFPLGINSPVDLVDWVQRAGIEFSFEGHPRIPQTKFDFETRNMQFQVPDDTLDETLRKQTYMAIGLSPETVDNGFNSEFATTVVSNNILLSKRVLVYQRKFTIQLTEHVKKIINNDPVIRNEILAIIKENIDAIKKYLADEDLALLTNDPEKFTKVYYGRILEAFCIELPKPDTTTIETQESAFTIYSESLDKAIEAWINTEFISTTVAGDIGNNVDLIKATYKAYFLRKWMSNNGYMNELGDITATDEDGQAVLDLYQLSKDHLDGIIRGATKYIKGMQDMANAASSDLTGVEASATAAAGEVSELDSLTAEEEVEQQQSQAGSELDLGGELPKEVEGGGEDLDIV